MNGYVKKGTFSLGCGKLIGTFDLYGYVCILIMDWVLNLSDILKRGYLENTRTKWRFATGKNSSN
jgi:hypothetical protein